MHNNPVPNHMPHVMFLPFPEPPFLLNSGPKDPSGSLWPQPWLLNSCGAFTFALCIAVGSKQMDLGATPHFQKPQVDIHLTAQSTLKWLLKKAEQIWDAQVNLRLLHLLPRCPAILGLVGAQGSSGPALPHKINAIVHITPRL